MSELHVTWRKDRPVTCGGCHHKFVPEDGLALGIEERAPADEIWPVVRCPNCRLTLAAGPAHVRLYTIQ